MAALVEALRTGDEEEVERLARRLGAARLLRTALAGPRPEERTAALSALPLCDEAWASLGLLPGLFGDRDAEVAVAAAEAARRIAERLTGEALADGDVPDDALVAAARALWAEAGDRRRAPTVRASALAGAAALGRLSGGVDPVRLAPLLTDPEPSLRRAAVAALDVASGSSQLERAVADDDLTVAAAATAALCAEVPGPGSRGRPSHAVDALAEPARARIRELLGDEARVPLADRLALIPCLRGFGTPEDRKRLDALARSKVPAIKRRARAWK